MIRGKNGVLQSSHDQIMSGQLVQSPRILFYHRNKRKRYLKKVERLLCSNSFLLEQAAVPERY